jgi:outer membrane protein assembly factor BamB
VKIRSNIALKVCLAVVLLLVGLAFFGCTGTRSSPQGGSGGTIADGTLFLCPALKQAAGGFGCSSPQLEGKLVAIDISSGEHKWSDVTLEASRPTGGGFGCAPSAVPAAVYGSPAVAGDLVYVAGYSGKVYAINSSSGVMRWVYPREGNLEPIVGGVVSALDKVYFGCSDGKVYALDAVTGDLQPGFPSPIGDKNKIWSTPAIDGDTLYIGSFDKKLYAIDTETGKEKWKPFETEGAIISTPLVYDNTVYIGSFDRCLYTVDATTGKQIWRFPATDEDENKPGSWFWAKPIIFGNTVYAPCLDGNVYILNAETGGEVVDAIDLGGPVSSSPVLVDNKVIVATEEGKIYAIDTGNNQKSELKNLAEKVYAPLCASDGVIYIYTGSQNLYALSAESGATLWSLSLK